MTLLARRSFLTLVAATGLAGATAACADLGSGSASGDPGAGADASAGSGDGGAPERDGDGVDVGDGIVRRRVSYADHDEAFADLWLPAGEGRVPVVVLIHGGFWREQYRLDLMDGLARSLAAEGFAAWNIEYRRVGGGGGYPETFVDVAAAVDHLAALAADGRAAGRLDLDHVAVVGHSAGGHLATWTASRLRLPAGTVGADPLVTPVVAFPQAGVLDLVGCAEDRVGGSACPDLLGGGPDEVPDRYDVTSPLTLLPIGVAVVAIHGTADDIVPPSQSRRYVDAAVAAGDPATLIEIDGADHFDVIDPTHEAWRAVLDVLPGLLV